MISQVFATLMKLDKRTSASLMEEQLQRMYKDIQAMKVERPTKQKAFLKKFYGEDHATIDNVLDRMGELARAFHFDPTYIFRTLQEKD